MKFFFTGWWLAKNLNHTWRLIIIFGLMSMAIASLGVAIAIMILSILIGFIVYQTMSVSTDDNNPLAAANRAWDERRQHPRQPRSQRPIHVRLRPYWRLIKWVGGLMVMLGIMGCLLWGRQTSLAILCFVMAVLFTPGLTAVFWLTFKPGRLEQQSRQLVGPDASNVPERVIPVGHPDANYHLDERNELELNTIIAHFDQKN